MTNAVPNFQIRHDVQFGYKDVTSTSGFSPDLTKFLYSQPTLNVFGSSANNYAASVSFANNIRCINFTGGVRLATIQAATLATQTTYTIANTSGTFPVSVQLDNGGTVGGLGIYPLNSGTIIQFQFDGTNLS